MMYRRGSAGGAASVRARAAVVWLAALAAQVAVSAPAAAQDAIALEIKQRIEQLRAVGSLAVGGRTLRGTSELPELYEARSFAPLWMDPRLAAELARAVREAEADGLDPAHYDLSRLELLASATPSAAAAADLDLLRTDALLRLVHDLRRGRVDPALRGGRSMASGEPRPALREEVLRIVESGRIREGVAAQRPAHFVYAGLVQSLAELRRVAAEGGWERIPDGPALRPDSVDLRVPALRRRLVRSGDLAAASVSAGGDRFDAALEAALRRFQHRHGLNDDGVLGAATLAELNVPVERRIEQLRVNLERARWFTHDLPRTFVVVNVAGARVYLVRDGEVVFETRAIVGKEATRTPVFRATMRYIDLNPTWTVPPGIVGEVLAHVRRDHGYLRRQNIVVLDRGGRRVDVPASTVARYSASGFPYVFRQEPGPLNPLGRIKFVFPNPHHVYLHDTPSKSLFEREQRTFSHGCIRVQNPIGLAVEILNEPTRWSRASLLAALEPGRTRTVTLDTPLPVLVLYWTASADLHGELHFYRDVYGRDASVLEALRRP
jgi:L,D-transpeptidase YcbB